MSVMDSILASSSAKSAAVTTRKTVLLPSCHPPQLMLGSAVRAFSNSQCMSLKIAFLMAVAIVFPSTHASAQEISLSNPGFEQELSDWNLRTSPDMCSARSEASRSGNLGLRIEDKSETEGCEIRSLSDSAEMDTEYEFSFWARTLDGSGPIQVALVFLNEKGQSIRKKNPTVDVPNTPDWTQFRLKVRSPTQDVSGMYLAIRTPGADFVTADLDDFEILKVSPPSSAP